MVVQKVRVVNSRQCVKLPVIAPRSDPNAF